jgi:hypothetical protein
MTQVAGVAVGQWSGSVTYEGKVDEYTVVFDEDGTATLSTTESTGEGTWSATGPDTFTYTIKEYFKRDESGAVPDKVIPGAAYVEINIEARRSGATFAGSGTAYVRTADGQVIHSTAAETSAALLPAD